MAASNDDNPFLLWENVARHDCLEGQCKSVFAEICFTALNAKILGSSYGGEEHTHTLLKLLSSCCIYQPKSMNT